MRRLVLLAGLLLTFLLIATGCDLTTDDGGSSGGGTSTSQAATTDCPIPAPFTIGISGSGSSGDVSSLTVKAGSDAIDERPDPEEPWCDLTELSLTKLDVATEVAAAGCPWSSATKSLPCQPYGMLAAVEVEPTPVRVPVIASRPSLVYDLDANPRQQECESGCALRIYQLKEDGSGWKYVGTATESTDPTTNKTIAEGNLSHFSVFALVELPEPEALPGGGGEFTAIVASDFIDDDPGTVTVQVIYRDGFVDTTRELSEGVSPLFTFTGFDLLGASPDPACQGTSGETLSCLFPIDTQIALRVLEDRVVTIERLEDGLFVEFVATVEIR